MTVAELGQRMTARELTEWAAYERVTGPFGGARGDVQAALTALHVMNALGTLKRTPKLSRLLPQWDDPPPEDVDLTAAIRALNRAFGGTETGG